MMAAVDCLAQRQDVEHWKAKGIDLSSVLYNPADAGATWEDVARRRRDHGLDDALDGN